MNNMASIIKAHNTMILKRGNEAPIGTCNCRDKSTCPLDGKCLTKCIVYEATIKHEDTEKVYYGLTEGDFKARYNNHNKSINHRKYESETELSSYIWDLKDKNIDFSTKWNIAARAQPYVCGSRRCDLCLTEKVIIATSDPNKCINKRDELVSKCRHQNKYKLKNLKS